MTSLRPALCTVALLSIATAAPLCAQERALDRGSIQIGGTAGFSSEGGDNIDGRATMFQLHPQFRYFVAPGLALGADVTLGASRQNGVTVTTYGLGPAVTWYFSPASEKVHPYVSGSASWARTSASTSTSDDLTNTGVRGAAGLLFMLSPAVGVSSELYYRAHRFGLGGVDRDRNAFGLAIGIAAFVF